MTETDVTSPAPRRRGLGRGLDALLGGPLAAAPDDATTRAGDAPSQSWTTDQDQADTAILIEIDPARIRPNPEQPRSHFDEDALTALTESIRLHGVLHPVVIERSAEGGYQLVAGERRWRAAQRAGVATIPAIVRPAAESARHALELALTENLVRADLTPMEEATAYSRLADAFGLTHDAIALRVGRSRPQVSNTIRLLQLPAPVQQAVTEGRLSAGHARALLGIEGDARRLDLAARAEAAEMSVRELEREVARLSGEPEARRQRRERPRLSADDEAIRRGMERSLGTPVQLQRSGKRGRIVLEFFTDDDLGALYERLGGAPL